MALKSINPANGELIRAYDEMESNEVEQRIAECDAAQRAWRQNPVQERAAQMRKAAEVLRSHQDAHARVITEEMGKPLRESLGEIEKCAWVCDYYAENAERFLSDDVIESDASRSFVRAEPLGVLLAVMPWNFPYWQVFRFAAPALTAGNGVLLKHASNVCGCAIGIEEVFREAGFPPALFRSLLIGNKAVEEVIEHPAVRAVTLTGSTTAGRKVAAKAGEQLKKCVLELGGSDPYLVLGDADLELSARTCAASRLINSGQSCIAAKRFIVDETVRNAFLELFLDEMKGKCLDDPMNPDTQIGPLARSDLRDELHAQVEDSVRAGAERLLGGESLERPGFFYLPTVLGKVAPGMRAFDEELFGPVAAVISAADEDEAVELANRSSFGLGAAVFTRDSRKGERIADRLEAGNCFINSLVKSDPRLPFGGIKDSGYGRELGSYGIREFVNLKTVYEA